MRLPFASLLQVTIAVSAAFGAALTFDIPPIRSSLDILGQPVAVTLSGSVSAEGEQQPGFRLRADLVDFQAHLTPLLQEQLNQSNHCGERISVEDATIIPAAPAARLTVRMHLEKWACIKAFGKENAKRLIGGDGTVSVLLTPVVDRSKGVRLDAEVGDIQADGSLGEALRSGSLGAALQDKIRDALAKSVRKAADPGALLPAQMQSFVRVESVAFGDAGDGRLLLNIAGALLAPPQQITGLLTQLRGGTSAQ